MSSDYEAKTRYRGDVAASYRKVGARSRQWRREFDALDRFLGEIAPGERILDLPFGIGRFAPLYAQKGAEVVGIDISPDMLAEAAADPAVDALGATLITGDAEQIPLPDASVDWVVCMRFINWLPPETRENVLGEFHRVARKGLIVQVRLREAYPVGGFAAQLARSSLANAPDVARAAIRPGRGALSRLLRGPREPGPPRKGYSTPEPQDFEPLLERHGFEVRSRTRVHEDVHFARREIFCKRLYLCARV
jgi:SAM-dependent methyltransferase